MTIYTIARLDERSKLLPFSLALALLLAAPLTAQRDLAGTPEILTSLNQLRNTGSILMIAAHPDDESTALLAYFSRGRNIRTAYLSLTRGEGGQNLIGPEQGALLGVIRTQEMLAARRIDGAEQYFARAIDFGFTNSADEAITTWGRDEVVSDIVWVIRKFQPDVILLRWTGTKEDGHGQHQASAILSREAIAAAANPARYPGQLKYVDPWQTKRVAVSRGGRRGEIPKDAIPIDVGEFNPVLGHSYDEIAGMSRSQHRSQGQGAAEPRGSHILHLGPDSGPAAKKDLFEDIDTTWRRVKGGAEIAQLLDDVVEHFDAAHPEKSVPALMRVRPLLADIQGPLAARKLTELDEVIASCAGLWLDANADRSAAVGGSQVKISATAVNRSHLTVLSKVGLVEPRLQSPSAELKYNRPVTEHFLRSFPPTQPVTQPYWLQEPPQGSLYAVKNQDLIGLADSPPLIQTVFHLTIDGQEIQITRPVINRYVNHILGERTRPFAIVPPVTVTLPDAVFIFPNQKPKDIDVEVQAREPNATGEIAPQAPAGWTVEPKSTPFHLKQALDQTVLTFRVTPPAGTGQADLRIAGQTEMSVLDYPHIPLERVFAPAKSALVRADIQTLAHNIGYVMGTGDQIPQALRQIGCEVTLLDTGALATGDLSRYDAIVTGVRAFNVRPDLNANRDRLFEYVKNGGTLVVQYNTLSSSGLEGDDNGVGSRIGPYPMKITHDRVTQENAPVDMIGSPVLQSPNRITSDDFAGWVQERGLYFAGEWDPRYQSLFESHDSGQKPLPGGTLFARYGQGAYVFTAYSWFRELPAGVPGAFRVFADLLSAGKTLQ